MDLGLIKAITSMIGVDRIFKMRLGSVVTISSSALGIVNSVLNVNAIASSADFSSFSTIFTEFFVVKMTAAFVPVSRYQYPLTGVAATSISNRLVGVVPLYHSASAYTSVSTMSNNSSFKHHSTADPFSFTWVNNEDWRAGVTSSSTNQSWLPTASGGSYNGFIQFLSNAAPPALPASEVLGDIVVSYDVLFRARS